MGSADWMNRNLHHRIEVCVALNNISCKKELIDYFDIQWGDNDKMVELSPNLEPHYIRNGNIKTNAQRTIYEHLQKKT
jgi:polyphosphate kinase